MAHDAHGAPRQVVGPVPAGQDPDRYDRQRRRILWAMPAGLYVVGSCAPDQRGGRERNLMTCNWCFQVAVDPKMVAVSVDQGARTHRLIESGGVFSVNLIAHQDRSLVRKFVKPVAEVTEDGQGRAATMAGQEVYEGHSGAPVLRRALAYLDCTVRHHLALGSHSVFVGQVVDAVAHVDETELGQHVLAMGDTKMSYGG